MEEQGEYHLEARLRVNLDGLSGGLHRQLQGLMNFVALGRNASEITMEEEALSLSDVELPHRLSGAPELWDAERLRKEFRRWILASGVRDAVEAFSGVLESAREILAAWFISLEGEQISPNLWNRRLVDEGHSFQGKGLPDKLDFLRKKYAVALPPSKEEYLLSINRARNCLVHRSGIVALQDIRAKPNEIKEAIRSRRTASPTEPWTNAQVMSALSLLV